MKIVISYPPLKSSKGVPLLSQNRQFQWFNTAAYIYPMLPAYTATILKNQGFDVLWRDCIAEEWSLKEFMDFYRTEDFDILMLESKTPVIKQHWEIVKKLKKLAPDKQIVIVGDHVTANPEETMEHCPVDFVLTGGNYDFLMLNLCKVLKQRLQGQENLSEDLSSQLEPGIYYRFGGEIKNTGPFILNHDLNENPVIDRELTKWKLYAYNNGNFKRTPGTYTMAARDCWHHKCTFCSWTTLYPQYHTREPESLLDEIGMLIDQYGIKEIMDDSGAFPVGKWLHDFCRGMIRRGYHKKVKIDCNMRFSILTKEEYALMKRAGFRLVLFGLESANQRTLDRIQKKVKFEDMMESCKMAAGAGLSPHITIMFGYPWEGEREVQKTVRAGRFLMKKGYASTLQATMVIPYPGTPLHSECKEKGWLLTEDYEDYDMRTMVMSSPVGEKRIKRAIREVYQVAFSPEFILHKCLSIRDLYDVKFVLRAVKRVIGHLLDFGEGKHA